MTTATRILLCRLGCVAFCLAPTALVGGWTCWRASSGYALAARDDWEHALAQRLGLVARVGAISYPGPGLARLENLTLLDPESQQPTAEAAIVEVAAGQNGWHVELWQPQVHSGGLATLARLLDERLLRAASAELASCTLHTEQLTIFHAASVQSLVRLSAQLTPQPTGPELVCEFRLPEAAEAAAPIRLNIGRDRQQSPPVTCWQLDTAGQALPCEWLTDRAPAAEQLGRNCRFAGTLTMVATGGTWSGTAAGRWGPLDLDALVSERFGHQLSGQATLDVERLAIAQGQLAELRGRLRAQHGAVSPSLLAAAQQHMQLGAEQQLPESSSATVPFQQLAVQFHFSGRELMLAGEADPTQPGVVIAAASGPLLTAPPQHRTACINLLRALLPASEFQVPATRQTRALIQLIPIPEVAQNAAAHTPTRLAPTPAASPQPAVRQPAMR